MEILLNRHHIKHIILFRLLNKVEDLERLMNDEVTDINEILNVINTIQVQISRSTKLDIFINLIFSG